MENKRREKRMTEMHNFRPLIVTMLVMGIFAIAFINFGLNLATINNPNQTIANSQAISSYQTSLQSSLSNAYANANASEEAISTSPTTLTGGLTGIIFDSIAGIWKTMKAVPLLVYNLTIGFIFTTIFGGSGYALILSVISAIVLITIVLAVWKLVSQGEGG